MSKRIASNRNIAVTFFVTFNIISLVPLFAASVLAQIITSNVWIYILANCIFVVPVPYLALKFAAGRLNNKYIIKDKATIISSVLKYLLTINGLFFLLNVFLVGYIAANIIVGVFTVALAAVTIYKFAPQLVRESTKEEVDGAAGTVAEPPLLRSVARTALLTVLGFFLLLVVPGLGLILYSDSLGSVTWIILIAYFSLMILLFRKIFFSN